MRSITTFDLQYAHRFYGFQGEAQYLHGHTGVLTIEVEDSVNEGVNMVYPCNEIQKVAWDVLKNFDHALILRQDDPLLPAILDVYEKQGIKNGHPRNTMKGEAFKTELAQAYPDARLVVTKETMTVEGMIKIVYDLLKDKLKTPGAGLLDPKATTGDPDVALSEDATTGDAATDATTDPTEKDGEPATPATPSASTAATSR